VTIALTVFELQRLNLGDPNNGVDHFFGVKTNEAEKESFYLESLEEQISFLGKFNDADPNVVVNANLDDLGSLTESWKDALSAWRKGDIKAMVDSLGADDLKTEFPEIYKVLLTELCT